MSVLKKTSLFLLFLVFSCSNITFLYDDNINITNPLYNKTKVNTSGKEISSLTQFKTRYFGNTSNHEYIVFINIEENKTRKSVQKNQAIIKLDYEIRFNYVVENINLGCNVFQKEIFSRFSHVPKSSGYNFGSDQSLNRLYELAIKENLQNFISHITTNSLTSCINEN